MNEFQRITRKEFSLFFASPAALLFLGAFLAVTLFVFFWVETFFARNIADVRPLFSWMPILLIFLVAALTMRSWSEERRSGSLETLLTSPTPPVALVLGKFAAGMALVTVALVLTLPLPLTVALLGPIDWGPVLGGYLATLFLAAAYVSIGLYLSTRTDNPIVALIMTMLVCSAFYFIGSPTLTNLFDHSIANLLSLLGTGSRFESITRGVLDFRDLYYYLSIVGVFLTLNLHALEKIRWGDNPQTARHKQWGLVTFLAVANLVVGNLWLTSIGWARADMTQGTIYSLSPATNSYLERLREPLLIRGYFSAKTHPLLAPLVPRIKDLLKEYAVAGHNRVRVEFVDPQQDSALEEEAASRYGIRPVPFQMANRYQASVVNAYFDIVIAYGDQYEVLGYRDLIEIKAAGEQDLDVDLKNPEYAITGAIRKTLTAYQAGGNPFETFDRNVTFTGYMSDDAALPKSLVEFKGVLNTLLDELKKTSRGRLTTQFKNPEADGGQLGEELQKRFGFGPQIASLLDPKPFWFYMVLETGKDAIQVPLPQELTRQALSKSIEAAIKRLAPGFLKTVTLLVPERSFNPGMPGKEYSRVKEILGENVRVNENNLMAGQVPEDTDLLMVLGPKGLKEEQVFAIDQFLMQGGSIILATAPFDVEVGRTLTATKVENGLKDWLTHQGITQEEAMILDAQNDALPIPVQRQIGPIAVQEIRMMPYGFFTDLRHGGLNRELPITSGLGQLTVNWAAPITVDPQKNKERKVTQLLTTSDRSWTSDDLDVIPNYQAFPEIGFSTSDEPKARVIATMVEGRFESFFKGKPSPLMKKEEPAKDPSAEHPEGKDAQKEAKPEEKKPISSVIDRSGESARIILIASQGFAEDNILDLASQGMGTIYSKPLELLQNAVDWSLEDRGLLGIRSRGHFSRTLEQMEESHRMVLEYLHYGFAIFGLVAVWFWRRRARLLEQSRYQSILAGV
ncbi:MAG: Gldg family protein [Magnetococcales bacterium]|nr:Gldg family protein [Magnetococcales bacterium]MBF0149599.1 Gldg family protein [Magnetococcales bacterium]MBF0347869.1 Gldg family protein [Magnetococcales bacterium]